MALDIQTLINAGESETVELKQSPGEIQEILETVGAFANANGGAIIIGVARTGGISGVTLGKNTLEALANSIQQQTDPKVFPVLSTIEIDGKTVIGLQVSASLIKPVLVQGRGFKRIGRSNHMKVIEGNIIEQVPAAMEFIQRHISMAAEIVPTQLERLERWEFPRDALREAIINAACHRDYRDSGHIQIRIFDDRLEVWSPGLLPPEIAIADLNRAHNSRPRNHRIARAFFLIGYIEHWGTGTLRMMELCKEAGVPKPKFREINGCFVVTFRKPQFLKKYQKVTLSTERQEQIVEYLRHTGKITGQSYAQLIGISKRTANRDLALLTAKGILRQVGKGKTAYFELA